MAIANRTTAEVYALTNGLENVRQHLLVYRSQSRNPSLNADVDAQLAAFKVILDATVADVTPTPD